VTKALPRVMLTQRRKAMESARRRRSIKGGGRATPRAWPGQRALGGAISLVRSRTGCVTRLLFGCFLAANWHKSDSIDCA
jgi:hypothetical protein